tara:strand:- start:662 stop:895 length:234 start_codon:yes stop_codon:yes gene_type:complete
MEEGAVTAALVGVALALIELVKKMSERNNGGSISYRLSALEKSIEEMQQKIQDHQRAFYEFREESRIRWAKGNQDND